jgi:site-specific recombinase XerD
MRISKALELFLAEKKISGFTQKTLSFYHDSAGALVRFVQEAEGDVDVDALQEWIAPFFVAAQERGTTNTTRHTYWRGIKTFTRFLHAEDYIDKPIKLLRIVLLWHWNITIFRYA